MGRRRIVVIVLGAAALPALAAALLSGGGPPPPSPDPPGAFSFAALGDAPYYPWEDLQYRIVLKDLDAHDLGFVLHVGDIFWRPCTERLYRRSLDWFNGLRHPVILTPGDNEWRDCWEPGSGGFEPLDRLDRIRRIFFEDPTRSLGGRRLTLATQGGSEPYPEFVENARWAREGILFATVHLVGATDAPERFAGPAAAEEAKRRTEAAAAWARETFAEAGSLGAAGVVLGFHGGVPFEAPPGDPYREGFEPFVTALEEEAERFGRPVLVVHGDDHTYTVDHPLVRRTTGRRLENLTRLEVPGSPEVGWVRVVVTPGAEEPFAFEERVVPRWKYW